MKTEKKRRVQHYKVSRQNHTLCRFSALWYTSTMLFHRDSLLTASRKEQRDAIGRLISASSIHSGYYFLLILSSVIATCGILADNIAVVIGGMILAPLLVPILLLALSLLNGSMTGCFASVRIIFASIIIAVVTSFTATILLQEFYVFTLPAWLAAMPAGIAFLIAASSGIAAALAWVKEDLSSTIAGVAVAVSLLPPLDAVGVGLATQNFDIMANGYVLFLSNLIGIVAGAFIVFLFLGFFGSRKIQTKAIEENGDQ